MIRPRVLPGLFELPQPPAPMPAFDGPAYEPAKDHARLSGQLLRVFTLMQDGQWRTLHAIAEATSAPESSVSAQLRHLRKPRFGGYDVQRRRVTGGLWEYRVDVSSREA